MAEAKVNGDGTSITVSVPMAFRHRGGRKLVVAADGQPWTQARQDLDDPLIRALARAWRWKRMLESGRYASITELAEAESNNQAYVGRVLRLTLLAPEMVEAVLDGGITSRQPIEALLRSILGDWRRQLAHFDAMIGHRRPPSASDG